MLTDRTSVAAVVAQPTVDPRTGRRLGVVHRGGILAVHERAASESAVRRWSTAR